MVALCCVVLCFGKPKKAEAVHTHATITIVIGKEGERERERQRGEKKKTTRLQIPRQRILRAGQYIPIHPSTHIEIFTLTLTLNSKQGMMARN